MNHRLPGNKEGIASSDEESVHASGQSAQNVASLPSMGPAQDDTTTAATVAVSNTWDGGSQMNGARSNLEQNPLEKQSNEIMNNDFLSMLLQNASGESNSAPSLNAANPNSWSRSGISPLNSSLLSNNTSSDEQSLLSLLKSSLHPQPHAPYQFQPQPQAQMNAQETIMRLLAIQQDKDKKEHEMQLLQQLQHLRQEQQLQQQQQQPQQQQQQLRQFIQGPSPQALSGISAAASSSNISSIVSLLGLTNSQRNQQQALQALSRAHRTQPDAETAVRTNSQGSQGSDLQNMLQSLQESQQKAVQQKNFLQNLLLNGQQDAEQQQQSLLLQLLSGQADHSQNQGSLQQQRQNLTIQGLLQGQGNQNQLQQGAALQQQNVIQELGSKQRNQQQQQISSSRARTHFHLGRSAHGTNPQPTPQPQVSNGMLAALLSNRTNVSMNNGVPREVNVAVASPAYAPIDYGGLNLNQIGSLAKKQASRKRKKRQIPEDAPRKPLSAYNFFFSEERVRILDSIPEPNQGDDDDADDRKLRAEEESDDSDASEGKVGEPKDDDRLDGGSGCATDNETSMKSELEDDIEFGPILEKYSKKRKVKRSHSKTHGKINFTVLSRRVGDRWSGLPTVQRQYYKRLAAADSRRYKREMEEYTRSKAQPELNTSENAKTGESGV
jgi:hypothetical protein